MNILNLIQEKESIELFRIQEKILEQINQTQDIYHIIRLGLLQTLPPVEDYQAAIDVLLPYIGKDSQYKLEVIGAYICAVFIFDEDCPFLSYLKSNYSELTEKIQSIVCYIEALYNRNRNINAIPLLKKSILICDTYVNNLVALAQECRGKERQNLLKKAESNIKHLFTVSDIEESVEDLWDYIEPDNFIEEFITGETVIKDKDGSIFAF